MNVVLPDYILRKSTKSRHVRIKILPGGILSVSAPNHLSKAVIDSFLLKHIDWINEKLEFFKNNSVPVISKKTEKKLFEQYKYKAQDLAEKKVLEHNRFYNFRFGKIAVRNSKSRWGSCSTKGTLSFNYKIVFLGDRLADYLVVHEICHLKEHNHGKGFWDLVGQTIPDYKVRRAELKKWDKTFVPPDSNI